MSDQRHQCDNAADHGVPVEDAVLFAHAPVGPQRLEKVAISVERDAAYDITQRRSKKDGQQDARQSEDGVEEALPQVVVDVCAELNADAAQHEEPQDHGQGQVKAAEAGGIEQRKREVQRSAGGYQPDFIAVPYGADGTQDGAALLVVPADEEMHRAGSEIKAVKQNINSHHYRDDHEP